MTQHCGNRGVHFGNHDDALPFFRRTPKIFPARSKTMDRRRILAEKWSVSPVKEDWSRKFCGWHPVGRRSA
jgi:hypothetical protein